MKKNRKFPNKKQNNYGGDYDCPHFDMLRGDEYCEIGAPVKIINGKIECKGNLHSCVSFLYKSEACRNGK